MSGIQLTDEQKEKILRRGLDADAFIHSPLFVDFKEWIDQEERSLASTIAMDMREEAQKNLTRSEFVEQMSGYYRGIKTALAVFSGFVSKANELQKALDDEGKIKNEENKEKIKMEELRKKAFPDGH